MGPLATALAALIALIVGIITVRQRITADRHDHWWKRAQWALDLTLHPDVDKQLVGYRALGWLATSKLASRKDLDFIDVATEEPLAGNIDANEGIQIID